jgi:hypothetical protein
VESEPSLIDLCYGISKLPFGAAATAATLTALASKLLGFLEKLTAGESQWR